MVRTLCAHAYSCRIVGSSSVIFGGTLRSHLDELELDVRWQIATILEFSTLPLAGITNPSSLPPPWPSLKSSHQTIAAVSSLASTSIPDPSPVSTLYARARLIFLKYTFGVFDSATYSLGFLPLVSVFLSLHVV